MRSLSVTARVRHCTALRAAPAPTAAPSEGLHSRSWHSARGVAVAASSRLLTCLRTAQAGGVRGGYAGPPSQTVDLSKLSARAPALAPPPAGCGWYETMLLLRPDATEAERAAELAKISSFLQERGVANYEVLAKDPTKTSYPIKGHDHVYYVQLTYAAPPATVKAMHELFAVPVVGAEAVLLRYMSFRR